MFPGAPSLADLWQPAARHHGALKGFVLARAALWSDPAIRRTARQGLAVLAAMLRRLLHLLAREVVLPPLRVRTAPEPLDSPVYASKPSLGFRLTETVRERTPREPNPAPTPDTPALSHALFLDRLVVLANAYRARHRIARRLARRAQSRRAPLATAPFARRSCTGSPKASARCSIFWTCGSRLPTHLSPAQGLETVGRHPRWPKAI